MDEQNYSVVKHFQDLRKVVVRSSVGVFVTSVFCLFFSDAILAWLRKPMVPFLEGEHSFVILSPHEYFFTEIKAALIAGIFLASPWIMYQLWLFIAPGLYRDERKHALVFTLATAFFFISGALFAYTVVFPPMFQFFIKNLPAGVTGAFSVGVLFGFETNLLLAFGLVFETPVLVIVLVKFGLVEIQDLTKCRRYVIVAAFVVSAILTPTPDPMTQTLMALPIILLYEVGIWVSRVLFLKPMTQAQDLK